MADNVAITAGSGTTVATDDAAGVHFQRVKLVDGTLDSTTAIASGNGVAAGALRVSLASDGTGVVAVTDNAGSLTVDAPVATPVFVRLSDGATAITTLPVSLATAPTTAVTFTGSNDVATQTTLAAINAKLVTGTDIGDVTINNAAGASAVNIQDGGNIITVDGTVSANATLSAETTKVIGTVNIASAQTLATVTTVGAVTSITNPLPANTNTQEVVGDAADAAAQAGNPVSMGLTARTTNRTAVTDGQAVRAAGDDMGRALVVIGQPRDLIGQQHTQIASSSAETTIVTAVASTFCDLVQLVITNQTATAVNVTIKDSTAGTTRMIIALAASGGAVIPFPRPIPQATVNNNWTATLSSAAVTVNIFALFERNV